MEELDIREDAEQPTESKDQGKGKDEQVTISKAELESLRRERNEALQSERSWAEIARRGAGPQTEQTAAVEEDDDFDAASFEDPDAADVLDDDSPEKLVEEIAAKGAKAISGRGFVTAKQAQRIAIETARAVAREVVDQKYQKVSTDAQIMAEFPELRDPSSELFRETAPRLQAAVKLDPRARNTPAALYLAARAAKDAIEARGGGRSRQREDDDYESESDRRQRARSQDSRPNGRRVADDDDMLGDEAKAVIAGMGITDEQFLAERKQLGMGQRGRRR